MPATENYPYLTNLRVEKLWKVLLDLGNAFENGSQFALLLAMIISTNHMRLNFDNVYSTRSTDAWFRPVPSLIVVSC